MSDDTYFPNGQIEKRLDFNCSMEWYDNGVKKTEMHYGHEEEEKVNREWYENGQMKSENFDDRDTHELIEAIRRGDLFDNPRSDWYDNGRLKSRIMHVQKGELLGQDDKNNVIVVSESWFENGEVESYQESINNKMLQRTLWHKNGFTKQSGEYDNDGKPMGEHLFRYESWFRQSEEHFLDGKRSGDFIEWYESGELKLLGKYENGLKEDAFSHWDEEGNLTLEEVYKADKLINVKKEKPRSFFRRKPPPKSPNIPHNGEHITRWPNGNKKDLDHYRDGRLHGICSGWFFNSVLENRGNYKDGEMDGLFTWYFDNGHVRSKQEFLEGKWHGECVWWYPDGTLKSRSFHKLGKSHGDSIHYFRNGEIKVTEIFNQDVLIKYQRITLEGLAHIPTDIKNGHIEGCYNTFFSDGCLKSIITESDGHPAGPIIDWYHNGNKWRDQNWTPSKYFGDLHGVCRKWYVDGTPMKEITYNHGQKDGTFKTWYRDGTPQKSCSYIVEKEDGDYREWFPNGTLKEKRHYIAGKRVGEWIEYDEAGKEIDRIFYPDI